MSEQQSIEALLRWRLARAAADAPPAPSAARLLALVRPWWEEWPARWQTAVARLACAQVAYGHAMSASEARPGGHPVPVLVLGADGDADVDALARVLYLSVRDGRLRLRLLLSGASTRSGADFEATIVGDDGAAAERPLFVARAVRAAAGEYRLDTSVTDDLARSWAALRVTDRMPFRIVLRPLPANVADVL